MSEWLLQHIWWVIWTVVSIGLSLVWPPRLRRTMVGLVSLTAIIDLLSISLVRHQLFSWWNIHLNLLTKAWLLMSMILLGQIALIGLITWATPKEQYIFWDIFDRVRALALFLMLLGLIWTVIAQQWPLVYSYVLGNFLLIIRGGVRSKTNLKHVIGDAGMLMVVMVGFAWLK